MSANYNYNYDTTSTDEFGHAIPSHSHSLAAGVNGPLLLQDYHLINNLAHFDRERIPERVVHAKGAGAHGYLEITADMTKYCKAAFLNRIGKRTPLFARFSTVAGERGSADSARDPRGFAVKMYTEEGNYDIVGNNTPVFFIRDTMKFPHFIHTQKRNPKSNLRDPNAAWDFWTLTPESVHQVTMLFTDRFTPYSFRHMNGYSSHTYKWVNKAGEAFWIKYHFKTDQGIKNFNNEEAEHMAGADPDVHTRDLFETIENGGQASWTLCVQIMPYEDAFRYRFDPFDVTKVWPHKDYPLIPFAKMVLNRNPENYFAETEQAAFSPANLVPGVEPSPDKMLQGRLFSYNDTHRHRLGANYGQIPINAPLRAKLNTYQRDGPMCVTSNGGSGPNYGPNTFGGHTEAPHLTEHADRMTGGLVRSAPNHQNSDFVQVAAFYRDVLTEKERQTLIHNIVSHVKNARRDLQVRAVQYFARVDKDFGARLQKALNLSSL